MTSLADDISSSAVRLPPSERLCRPFEVEGFACCPEFTLVVLDSTGNENGLEVLTGFESDLGYLTLCAISTFPFREPEDAVEFNLELTEATQIVTCFGFCCIGFCSC